MYSNTGYYTDNIYQVSFSNPPDGWDLDDDIDICVQIKAIPTLKDDNSPYTDIPTIGRILGLRKSRITGSNGWKANISEKTETNSPSPFDAYNLVLSGSGAATITISWDITKIDVNPFFYDSSNNVYHFDFTSNPAEIVDQGVTNGIHTIKINADTGKQSQNYRNIYKLQLYKLDGDPSSWAQLLGDWVTVDIQ